MLKKMKEYFDYEYKSTVKILNDCSHWLTNPQESKSRSIDRCLGVAFFIQTLDNAPTFEEIDRAYRETKEKIEAIPIDK